MWKLLKYLPLGSGTVTSITNRKLSAFAVEVLLIDHFHHLQAYASWILTFEAR